jgi:hypothetical protein
MKPSSFPLVLLLAMAVAASARELPCPELKPTFDYTKIDRTLKEPKHGSTKPAYRFLAFGPEGKTIIALVADESKGTGSGFDTLYVDLNANHDITEPGERFALERAQPAKPLPGAADPGLILVSITGWGKDLVKARKLDVPDPTFDYTLAVVCSFLEVVTATKDGSWKVRLVASDGSVPWSTSREEAPVFRYGGSELSLGNEHFVEKTEGRRITHENGVGQKLTPGTKLVVDGATPFFAGSSPSVVFRQAYCWVPGGHRGLRARIETVRGEPPEPHDTDIILHEY